MSEKDDLELEREPVAHEEELPKVYLLPNLFTAANLCCGLMAIMAIIRGTLEQTSHSEKWIDVFEWSLGWILAAFVCDLFDGRVARLGGRESPFGREFDSLADLVSFGVAPALLVYKIVLFGLYKEVAGGVAFLYLLCGALRLARFNVVTAQPGAKSRDFIGFPIPAAAGLIASITLFILNVEKYDKPIDVGQWRLFLVVLLVILSFMMFSKFRYPSFKELDWHSKQTLPRLVIILMLGFLVIRTYWWSLALIFLGYLLYGMLRPLTPAFRRARQSHEEKHAV